MELSRWGEIKEILHTAMNLSSEERSEFLDRVCGEDDRLRGEIEAYLRPDPLRFAALDHPVFGFQELGKQDLTGKQIDQYRLLTELGRGGMGVVYLAVRADDVYNKQVAVKILKWDQDIEYIFRRFLRERQILANLDHPFIARLLDGGTTEDGLPYYVMEFVKGKPIHDYCNDRNFTVRQRLDLFQRVCDAVQYAHQNLVVHRDLKPGNILVNEEGEPRLLDFGIAKLLAEEPFSHSRLTVTGVRAMTPQYASPEQIRGEPITTAADIYSLGVLLFELLTGRLPFQFQNKTDPEMQHIFRRDAPPPPSSVAARRGTPDQTHAARESKAIADYRGSDHAKLSGILSGDLDKIVLMALRGEPERRYASAEQFSQDIDYYLNGFPVRAEKDTFRYRSIKFIKRRRFALTGFAMAFTILLGALFLSIFQNKTIIAQRDRVQKEKERMTLISEFLVDLFELSDPYQAADETVDARLLLDKAFMEIENELARDPETRAALMSNLGRIYTNLGIADKAEPLLSHALAARKRFLGENHPDVAQSYDHLARLALLDGRYAEAETLFSRALSILAAHPKSDPLVMAAIQSGRGGAFMLLSRFDDAERDFQAVYQVQIRYYHDDHPELATTLHALAELYSRWKKYPEAEHFLEKTLGMRERLYAPGHALIGETLSNWGKTCLLQEKYDEAEAFLRRALDIQEKTLGADHPVTAVTLAHLAGVFNRRDQYDQARVLMARSLAIKEKVHGDENPSVAAVMINLAMIYKRMGKYEDSERLYLRAIQIFEITVGDHLHLFISFNNMAMLYLAQNRLDEAIALMERAWLSLNEFLGPQHQDTALHIHDLAQIYALKGDYERAISLLCEALRIDEQVFGLDHPNVARDLLALAKAFFDVGDHARAEDYALRSCSILEDNEAPETVIAGTRAFLDTVFEAKQKPRDGSVIARQ